MAPPRRRSQLDQLYSDGSQSRLDPNPGLDEATTDATRRRVAVGRADRVIAKAMRSNDPKMQAWGAEQTLARSKTIGWEGPPAGVTQHGQFDQKDRSSGLERIERGVQMKDEATRPGGPKNVGDQPTRDGLAPPAPSTPSLASSDTEDSTTPPAQPTQSGNGMPASSSGSGRQVGPNGRPESDFEMMDREARERIGEEGGWGKPKTNFAKKREEFKSDLEKSNLIKTGRDYEAGKAPEEVRAAQAKALERGLSLGGNREQLQAMIGMETDSDAKTRKSQEYQEKFGESDQKYKALLGRTLSENGKPLTGEKATAAINKIFNARTPQERLDSISELSGGPSDKTKAMLLEAKKKAAVTGGYKGEVTADTDFGAEAKALIPGAKKEIQAIIDARDSAISDPVFKKTLGESTRKSDREQKASFPAALVFDPESNLDPSVADQFRKDTDRLKKFLGKPVDEEAQALNNKRQSTEKEIGKTSDDLKRLLKA